MKALEATGLCFRREGGGEVLNDISFDLDRGEALAILGPNGAGKSTLALCLLGLLAPQRGVVRINGAAISQLSRSDLARLIAYVPQSTQSVFAFEAEHLVLMGRSPHIGPFGAPMEEDRRLTQQAMELTGVWRLRHRPFTELSGGERQMVLIARALAQDAPIIVMDEPTASLDLGNQGRVLALVRDLAHMGKSIIMTTHLPDQAFNLKCRVALMKQGRLCAIGPVAQVCTAQAMSDLYGAPLQSLTGGAAQEIIAFAPRLD
ncbi:ABC transporter ATP-binding protein [Methylocystis heyeri]|uniref:ATP-binding cassette domain-containing protein n=1 Tax=Methylocystis heyeri TaxID=391905 RepID=A0A6B8KDA3_9HYPH|nr:ABC transporter ATP-binding protein [Methylocystis heyeri]QGM46216.1 ATP-binding cassette domain-containing protein [Methylocystis heyeri]